MLRTLATTFLLCCTLSPMAYATKILDFALLKDGSIEPPGDRLTLSLLFLPKESAVVVEIRAMELVGEGESVKYLPIKAANDADKNLVDGNGNLLLTTTIKREGNVDDAIPTTKELVIPYATFNLDIGTHHIYYEATVTPYADGKKLDALVSATRLTDVSIEAGVRTSLTRKKKVEGQPQHLVQPREVKAYQIEKNGELSEKVTEVSDVTVSAAAFESETVKVNIPGQFIRKETSGRPALPAASATKFVPANERVVRFATNRNVINHMKDPANAFGSEIAPLTFGQAVVNIPLATHKKGDLGTVGWFGKDPKKDFYVETIRTLTSESFYQELSSSSVLLYVHGYQNSFNDAILKAAQLQHDMEFPGKVVAFTWPSAASVSGYYDDEKMAEKSVLAMSIVIQRLIAEQKENKVPGNISIVAHSMGNRVVLFALNKLINDQVIAKNEKIIKNLVLAAPDVDLNQFGSIMPRMTGIASSITFYYSSKDSALGVSEKIHDLNRAGLFPIFYDGMDTISVDNVNSRWLSFGHGYYAASDKVLLDLNLNFNYGLVPDKRQPPLAVKDELKNFPGFPHYNFKQ